MSEPLVLSERDGDVVTLTFNDPERRNAMTEALGRAFSTQVAELADLISANEFETARHVFEALMSKFDDD